MTLDPGDLDRVVRAALEEDLRYGPDVTTAAVIPPGTRSVADIVARQPGILAGLPVVAAVLDVACPAATFTPQARDGDRVAAGGVVARVEGPLAEILTAERTLLNFLTHLSGIATATRAWVDAIDGTGAFVRDTRKTVPGLRLLEKYAVRCGGGVNHRMGLGDAALIKDNHITAAGGITAAFRAVLAAAPGAVTEVECDTLDQVGQALAAGAALILLDNMSPDQMRSAVSMARAYPAAKLEASGGLRLENARQVASTGVHYLSVGALTHSSPALDLALDVGLSADACQVPRPQDARTGDGRAMAKHGANCTHADVTKRERPLVTGACVPACVLTAPRCRTAAASRLVVMAPGGLGAGPGPGMPGEPGRPPGWRRRGCRRPPRTGRTARSRRSATRQPQQAGPVRSRHGGRLRPALRTGAWCSAGRGRWSRAGTARVVVVLGLQPVQSRPLPRTGEVGVARLGHAREVCGVPVVSFRPVSALAQPV
jgi:nicotinate-nucleotide pyrophosphorylase (carboxylating)